MLGDSWKQKAQAAHSGTARMPRPATFDLLQATVIDQCASRSDIANHVYVGRTDEQQCAEHECDRAAAVDREAACAKSPFGSDRPPPNGIRSRPDGGGPWSGMKQIRVA
jgi:hypothetical protein